jgi:glycosyltransferase involved in cell wall biosynthesis
MRRLRLAIVCDQLDIGGQEAGMLSLVRQLDRTRFAPRVYAFRSGPLVDDLRRARVPVLVGTAVPPRRRWTQADRQARIAFRRSLATALRQDRIDICLVYAWADAVTAAREAGVPAIVERVDGPKLVGWIRDKSSCQALICESRAVARLIAAQRDLFRCRGVKIAVIRNGVDLDRFDPDRYDRARCRRALGLEADALVVGTVARLVPVKNLGHLLEAVRLLVDRIGDARPVQVVIAGPDGGEGPALRAQARALGLAGRVRFLGPRADVPEVLRALDVFVLPSIQEGVSFALLEAMAMGLAVVATQTDSIAETLGDAGYLVSPLDPLRTALALQELLSHPAHLRELGRRSRQRALRHGLIPMVREYETVLASAFADGKRRPAFRRRIAVVPGHPAARRAGSARAIDALASAVRRQRLDTYAFSLTTRADAATMSWPPPRRVVFPHTPEGRAERRAVLEWIRPDVVVTECPRVVTQLRQCLAGEEIVYMPEPDHGCPGQARAIRDADRVLAEGPAARRRLVERWPRWSWKIRHVPALRRGRFVALPAVLAQPRPVRPRARRSTT